MNEKNVCLWYVIKWRLQWSHFDEAVLKSEELRAIFKIIITIIFILFDKYYKFRRISAEGGTHEKWRGVIMLLIRFNKNKQF